ncbi:MAG: hypothetical protein V4598_02605 [Bdellovibrionota bacterium]
MNYRIVSQKNISVITINGDISKDDRDAISQCLKELQDLNADSIILYFRNVNSIEVPVHRELALLQHEIRQKRTLKIVGLNSQLRSYLGEKGIIRGHEVGTSLNDVLAAMTKVG